MHRLLTALTALSLLLGCSAPTGGQHAALTGLASEAFSVPEAFGHVRHLAGRIGPRTAGSKGYLRAVRYVRADLDAAGWSTQLMGFGLGRRGRSWNVVARQPGATGPPSVLIGAHLDTVEGSPGGNDNASGVAVMLELARNLGTADVPGLALVAFGAEEFQPDGRHHIGSQVFVNRMSRAEREAMEVMVSADMIGKVRPYIVGRLAGTSRAAVRAVVDAAHRQGIRARGQALEDISDHGPFAKAGIPAAFLWTGFEPNHHLPSDVVKNCQRRALGRGGAILAELVETLL
jgi:aminopeptidase S